MLKVGYIGENVRLINALIYYKGIAIFLDLKKAFDSIERKYLLEALRLFYFGPDIQNRFKIFYNNVSSRVLNNGHASVFFNVPASGSQTGLSVIRRAFRSW